MSSDMMEVIHQAIDELQIGLDKLEDKQVKETYNALVALTNRAASKVHLSLH
jgi:hypothetical protein